MNRRALLRTLGAIGTAGALAGCIGGGPGSGGTPGGSATDAPGGETTAPDGGSDGTGTPASDGSVVEVGDRSTVAFPEMNRPHAVTVKNATADRVTFGLSLSAEARGRVWNDVVRVAPDDPFELRLNEPAHYSLELRRDPDAEADADATTVDDTVSDPDATVDVPLSLFDCNHSGTEVTVTADGVDTTTYATEIACADAELADTSFSAAEGTCGSSDADDASVRYDGESVRVTGTVSMPDPCREVKLSKARYDAEKSTLFLSVEVQPADPAATCVACVGVRDYEATATFEADLPDRVVVRHAGPDRPTGAVARAVRGGADGG